jgi:hypothetical protein
MLMVIFGAGASYDSSPDFPPPQPQEGPGNQTIPAAPQNPPNSREFWRPPLANQLFLDSHGAFGDIVANYRKLLPILPHLRRPSNGRSVEEELESFQEEANKDPEVTRQLYSVRYYLHDLLLHVTNKWLQQTSNVTNYVTLLNQIRRPDTPAEPICLVTFNYDLLLDRALLSFDYKPQDPEKQFAAHQTFKLFKPHGSVDWARLVDFQLSPTSRLQPEQLIEHANNIVPTGKLVVANATDPHQIFNFEKPIVPAIAIPVQTKTEDTFEWPKSHRTYLESLIPQVTKILIIGWQAREAHFLQLLRDGLPRRGREVTHLLVVGRDAKDGKEILHRFAGELGQSGYNTRHHYTEGGFTQFVLNREAEAFLRA